MPPRNLLADQPSQQAQPQNLLADASPEVSTAGGVARSFAQGLTFNFSDEAEASIRSLFGDESYQQELQQIRAEIDQFKRENPTLAIGSELGGAVISALVPGGAVVRGATAASRIGRGVLAGAGAGAVAGAGAGEGVEGRLLGAGAGAAIGGGVGAAAPAIAGAGGSLIRRLRGRGRANVDIPDTASIRSAKKAAYKQFDDTNVRINPESFRKAAIDAFTAVREAGFRPRLQTKAVVPLAELGDLAKRDVPISLQEVEILRRVFGAARKEIGTDDARIANIAVEKLDDFVDGLTTKQLTRGQGRVAARRGQKALNALKTGRQLARRERKSEILDGVVERAEIGAGAQTSRTGIDANLRREFSTLAKSFTRQTGQARRAKNLFNAQERKLIKRAATGTPAENTFTRAGRIFAPTSGIGLLGGPGLAGAAGTALAGPVGGALAGTGAFALGTGSRAIGNVLSKANSRAAQDFIRSGGQAGPQAAANPGLQAILNALAIGGGTRSVPQL